MTALIMFLPEEAYLAAMIIGAILVMIGFRKIGTGIIGLVIMMALFGPFIDSVFEMLPGWVLWLVIPIMFISLFGKGVRDHVTAWFIIRTLLLPFRLVIWLLRGLVPGSSRR